MAQDDIAKRMAEICALAPVIPVLVIHDAAQAVPLAQALVEGGLPVIEVTMRTPAALPAIRAMASVKGAIVGAGTVLSPDDMERARDAGAAFAVSPGATDALLESARDLPFLPGVATPSEAMRLLEHGLTTAKFFPARANGGPGVLAAWAGPLPQMRFCPTGGIGAADAGDWLALPNVTCVGGSWVAPQAAVAAGDWGEVTRLAREAAALRRA